MTEYVEDDYAIVQSPDFATLFILSRVQNVTDEKLAVNFGFFRGRRKNKKLTVNSSLEPYRPCCCSGLRLVADQHRRPDRLPLHLNDEPRWRPLLLPGKCITLYCTYTSNSHEGTKTRPMEDDIIKRTRVMISF